MNRSGMRERARRKLVGIRRRQRDRRYLRTLWAFVEAGLLTTNQDVPLHHSRGRLKVKDVLWAGEVEPRFLELLPAILVKRPSMLAGARELPGDLRRVARRLRRNAVPEDFRGIPGADIHRWLTQVLESRAR